MTVRRARLEDMTALLDGLDRRDDPRLVAEDEQARYDLYGDALRAAGIGTERPVLEIVQRDPDLAMKEAAIVAHIDRVAKELASRQDFSQWWQGQMSSLHVNDLPFAARRAAEWSLIKQIREGEPVDPQLVSDATDWLQRLLVTEAVVDDVLGVLASRGRTKRVRASAKRRLEGRK